jgi:hypothetical protein
MLEKNVWCPSPAWTPRFFSSTVASSEVQQKKNVSLPAARIRVNSCLILVSKPLLGNLFCISSTVFSSEVQISSSS